MSFTDVLVLVLLTALKSAVLLVALLVFIAFALYAICVFPANLKHAFAGVDVPGLPSSPWYHGPRFLLQPVLVWAALFCTDVLRWPFTVTQAPRSR